MKWVISVVSTLLCGPGLLAQAAARDGGGKDISVAMFSTHRVAALTISGVGDDAWVTRCEGCAHEPLRAPIQINAAGEWLAGGHVRVHDNESGEERVAYGLWHLRAMKDGIDVVLTLPSEHYVQAVLAAEAAPSEPAMSLQALAVVARTYALNGTHYSAPPGHLAAELCDSTACQAMRLDPVSAAVEEATRITAGETLWFGGKRAEVYFSQNCGGIGEDAGAIWPRLTSVSYLHRHPDPYCVRHGVMQWHATVSGVDLRQVALREGWSLPRDIVGVRVSERTASHRAKRILFLGYDGKSAAVSATALRFGIGRALGWNRVQSDAYEIGWRDGSLSFDGRGRGHGVGLCQAGAAEMAAEGKSVSEILAFYFLGTKTGVQASDAGWNETQIGALRMRSVQPIPLARVGMVDDTWKDAQKRFPVRKPVTAELVFAPSTELFRQLAAQPGWMLASTRGSTVILQPETILNAHTGEVRSVLLHEMLHVLVEQEASADAPLWLREGLVEVLAGETHTDTGTRRNLAELRTAEIERSLRAPSSWSASKRAHQQAATEVQSLVDRYGMMSVRGWLSSSVPAGVESR